MHTGSVNACLYKVCHIIPHHVVARNPYHVVIHPFISIPSIVFVYEGNIQDLISQDYVVECYICCSRVIVLHMSAVHGCKQHCPFYINVVRKSECLVNGDGFFIGLIASSVVTVEIHTSADCSFFNCGWRDSAHVVVGRAYSRRQKKDC